MATPRFDVFLSHNSTDKPAVLAIVRVFPQAVLEPWLDIWRLHGDDRWQLVLRAALHASSDDTSDAAAA